MDLREQKVIIIFGNENAFMKHAEFSGLVDSASLEKLARMLRVVAILAQTKVYLFWEKRKEESPSTED